MTSVGVGRLIIKTDYGDSIIFNENERQGDKVDFNVEVKFLNVSKITGPQITSSLNPDEVVKKSLIDGLGTTIERLRVIRESLIDGGIKK